MQEGAAENQLDALIRYVREDLRTHPEAYARGAYIITFTHGWHHNAKEGDENLSNFRQVLAGVRDRDPRRRPIIGLFLSWRGRSRPDPVTEYLTTFWHRKEVAERIGYRGMAETMTRLSLLRDEIARKEERESKDMYSRLIAVGHSFGAQALFSAVSRYFEDELIQVAANPRKSHVGRRWDLIVLVNPAFEAIRYDIINRYQDSLQRRSWSGSDFYAHLPRMVVAGAENDRATGRFFPWGQALDGRTRMTQTDEGPKVRQTLGNYEAYYTHHLHLGGEAGARLDPVRGTETTNGRAHPAMDVFRRMEVTSDPASIRAFMVAKADGKVVSGHGGIWTEPFKKFLVSLIAARELAVKEFRN